MIGFARTLFRVGRWHWAVPLAVLGHGAARLGSGEFVTVPLVDALVPVPVLLALATVGVVLVPLYSAFDLLESTLVRARTQRARQVGAALLLGGLATGPALSYDGVAALLCVLAAAGILAVVTLGDPAWVVALSGGFVTVLVDGSPSRPVATFLGSVPLVLWGAVLALTAAVYVLLGPREGRAASARSA